MLSSVSIEAYTSHPGIRWRLRDPTTELVLRVEGSPGPQALRRYADWFDRRFARCFRFCDGPFPHAWLVNPAADPLAVHLAAGITALQRLACQPVRRAQVLEAEAGLLRLALPSFNGTVLEGAIRLALQLLLEIEADPVGEPGSLDSLETRIEAYILRSMATSSTEETMRFGLAADRIGIPLVATVTGLLELGHGRGRRVLSNSLLNTPAPCSRLAGDKLATYLVLHRAGLPVPPTRIVNQESDLEEAAAMIGWPLVVKPLDQSLKRGVTTDVADPITLEAAYRVARNVSPRSVLVQRQVSGLEFRLTAIGSSLVVARLINPPVVVGDGISTVADLLEQANANPLRGSHPGALCARITVDDDTPAVLAEQELSLASVPTQGQTVRLSRAVGRSAGGLTTDATPLMHPSYFELLKRTARVLRLEALGMDLITPDPSLPWWEAGAVVLECNPRPGLWQHECADPDLAIYEAVLRHGLASCPSASIVAVAGGALLEECFDALATTLPALLPVGTRLGVLRNGCCTLGGEPLSLAASGRGQVGQALLADPLCGIALLMWRASELVAAGRPCERVDLAVLCGGADPQVAEEILDADPRALVWFGPDPDGLTSVIRDRLDRGGEGKMIVCHDTQELVRRLPELMRHGHD